MPSLLLAAVLPLGACVDLDYSEPMTKTPGLPGADGGAPPADGGTVSLPDAGSLDGSLDGGPVEVDGNLPYDERSSRVLDGLLAYYRFEDATRVVPDRSGVSPPIDLQVENPEAVRAVGAGLRIERSTRIYSDGPAAKVSDAVRTSGEVTVELWLRPAQLEDARLFILGQNNERPSIVVDQQADLYRAYVRGSRADDPRSGFVATGAGTASFALTHIVLTRSRGGTTSVYVQGLLAATDADGGDLLGFDGADELSIANDWYDDRPFAGELFLIAIYDRALDVEEVRQNHAAGSSPPVGGTF